MLTLLVMLVILALVEPDEEVTGKQRHVHRGRQHVGELALRRLQRPQRRRLHDLDLGAVDRDGGAVEKDARKIWRKFAENYHLFRGTPTRLWLDQSFSELFGMTVRLSAATADQYFDRKCEWR